MALINPFAFGQNTSIATHPKTTRNQPADSDHSKLFQLSKEQQKKLKEQRDSEKQLRQAASGGAGQGQAASLKRQMLYERLKLLLQQVALMDKQAAKAAMAEVKRLAGELRQMSAQPTASSAPATPSENTTPAEPAIATTPTAQPAPPTPGVNTPPVATANTQDANAESKTTAPTTTTEASKTQAGDDMEELKEMLKRILRALKKRMEDAPDNQADATNPQQKLEPSSAGMFIDIKV
ncbi:MAG: hypothetical protein B7Y41_15985 [Hydrogenophilales bacterium 28-61-23]|nr:MAG: hypothetical protein B7Y41_15985 [Hydrogenophilales bacterium 28-61-23]